MKTIHLYAYLANNFGDDLMVEILLNRYKNYRFYCDSPIPSNSSLLKHSNFLHKEALYKKYGRINHLLNIFLPNRFKNAFYRYVFRKQEAQCCCSVYIGGSIYMEIPGRTIEHHILREEKRLNHGPLFVIGANFGPYKCSEFKDAFHGYFSKCAGVSFRDKASFDAFSDLPHVQYAPDVLFNYPLTKVSNRDVDKPIIISVIDLSIRQELKEYTNEYEAFISNLCCKYVADGKEVLLVSFCESEGDSDAIKRIISKLPYSYRNKVKTYTYVNDIGEILKYFHNASFVISTRFHAMILALLFRKPLFAISYNQKVRNVLNDIGYKHYCELEDISSINVNDILIDYNDTIELDQYIRQAERQFAQFDSYIKQLDE